MRAIVVYESLWGNTAAIASAVAEGLGPDARAMSTAEATPDAIASAELLVVGAPVLGFNVPSDAMLDSIRRDPSVASDPPDTSQPSMRTWLQGLPPGGGSATAFETRIWWSPGGATKPIMRALEASGRRAAGEPRRFIVTGRTGPLKPGEVDRARSWGAELATVLGAAGR